MDRKTSAVRRALVSLPAMVIAVNALAVGAIEPLAASMIEPRIQARINEVTANALARYLNGAFPFHEAVPYPNLLEENVALIISPDN